MLNGTEDTEPSNTAESPASWDMSQERAFMENLFCQRFNFFLIVFTVVLGGAATATTPTKQTAILSVGCLLCLLIWLTIFRNYTKLMAILKQLHKNPNHPVAIVGRLVKQELFGNAWGVNWIIGITIPLLCIAILVVATLLSWTKVLKAN